MKILFFIFITLNASILKDKNTYQSKPESKKTLLDFDNKTQTIHIFSPNNINKITTQDKKSAEVKILDENPGEVKLDTKSHMFQDFEKNGNQSLDGEKNSIPDKIEGITEEQKVFSDLLSEITDGTHIPHGQTKVDCHDPRQHCSKNQKLSLAQENLEKLKKELKKGLESSKGKKPVVVDGNLLQTMVSYLNHLDYINQVENDYLQNPVPKMPKPLIIKHVVDENNEDEAINEKMQERKKEIEQKMTLIKAKMQDLKNESDEEAEQKMMKVEEEKAKLMQELEDIDNEAFTGDQKKQMISQIQKEYILEQKNEAQGKAQAAKDLQDEISQLENQAFKLEQQKKVEDKLVELDEEEQHLEDQKEDLEEEQEKEKIDNYELLTVVQEKIEEIEHKREKLENKDEELTSKIDADDFDYKNTHQGASLQREHENQPEGEELEDGQEVQGEQQQEDEVQQLPDNNSNVEQKQDNKQIEVQNKNDQSEQNDLVPHEQTEQDHNIYYVQGKYKIEGLGKTIGEDIKFDQYGNPKNFDYQSYLNDQFTDLPKIKAAVDKLTNGFIQLFSHLPYNEDEIPEDFELNRKKTLMIFNTTYNFIFALEDNMGEFYKDLKFLLEKLYNFEATKERIAEYYGQQDRYDDILEEVDKKSPDFIQADQLFINLEERFDKAKSNYQQDMQKILKLFGLLNKETQFLKNLFLNHQELLFENKVEVVEGLYPKMLSIKHQSIKIMSDIKNQLDDFKVFKIELIKILEKMDIAAMKQGDFYKKMNDILENSTLKKSIFTMIVSFLVFIFQIIQQKVKFLIGIFFLIFEQKQIQKI